MMISLSYASDFVVEYLIRREILLLETCNGLKDFVNLVCVTLTEYSKAGIGMLQLTLLALCEACTFLLKSSNAFVCWNV